MMTLTTSAHRYATKNARHVVTTKVWVTMAARMLPAWLRARPQNQPSVAASGTQRQFGKLPSHRCQVEWIFHQDGGPTQAPPPTQVCP
jgi:hypothetical protein